ncbi:MAG: universal stress protein [Flavobacteriaceae bacterium]
MRPIDKILLLTDFSEVSENAKEYALLIAKKANAEVKIMHIINTPIDWIKISLEEEKLYPETKMEIIEAKNNINELLIEFKNKGVTATQSIVFNVGVENIPQYIESESIELVIMGSHGVNGIKEYTLGSNAQKVLRKSTFPILIVKNKPKKSELSSIVFASTFDENQFEPFQKIRSFSDILDTELHLLYINTPNNFKETKDIEIMLHSFCESCEKKACKKHTYNAFNEERGIKEFMKNKPIDIFAIATEGRSSFAQLFSPSLTEAIANHLDMPVLSMHTV